MMRLIGFVVVILACSIVVNADTFKVDGRLSIQKDMHADPTIEKQFHSTIITLSGITLEKNIRQLIPKEDGSFSL